MTINISSRRVQLRRGDSFEVEVSFDYKGQPQHLTFELKLKQGLFGSQSPSVTRPGIDVGEAMDWGTVGPITLTFTVPQAVKDGNQDLQLHITAADGEHDESSWLTDAIEINP